VAKFNDLNYELNLMPTFNDLNHWLNLVVKLSDSK
jgi:hypothetical protein